MSVDRCPTPYALVFGEKTAQKCASTLQVAERVRRVLPALIDYESPSGSVFYSKTALAKINDLAVTSISASETRARVGSQAEAAFVFHKNGSCKFEIENNVFRSIAQRSFVFIPQAAPVTLESIRRSSLVVGLDQRRLEGTAQTMLGYAFHESFRSPLRSPSEMSLQLGRLSFDAIFQNLFSQIDAYGDQQALLDASGIDDTFYRTLAMAMLPKAFIAEAQTCAPKSAPRQLARVCDHVMASLADPLTLTELERIGHMSRRTLHNAFKTAFGMSPIEWVREQRLLAARSMLLDRMNFRTVTEVLYRCGFTNASLFSAQYLRRFKESPSQTAGRA